MIKGIFIVNNTGKARLIKVYERREFSLFAILKVLRRVNQPPVVTFEPVIFIAIHKDLCNLRLITNSNQYLSFLS